jgi:N utilization substance protein A
MEVVVPDDQLSLAIGRRGQNVRLASKLTGWKLDILSESDAGARTAQAIFSLMKIEGMSDTMAHNLFQSGFGSLELLSQSEPETLMQIPGYEEEEAAKSLIEKSKVAYAQHLKEEAEKPKEEESLEGTAGAVAAAPVAQAAPPKKSEGKDAKSLADERLKEQMAELDGAAAAKTEAKAEESTEAPSAD